MLQLSQRRWRPFDLLTDEMNRMLENGLHATAGRKLNRQPATNLYETEDSYLVVLETPGLASEAIQLDATEENLTLSGTRAPAAKVEDQDYRRQERWTGQWRREVAFPGRVDPEGVSAELKDGVLSITLPKAKETRPRRIQISPTA